MYTKVYVYRIEDKYREFGYEIHLEYLQSLRN